MFKGRTLFCIIVYTVIVIKNIQIERLLKVDIGKFSPNCEC